MTKRNSRNPQPRPTFGTRSIDINKIYSSLQREMSHRQRLQEEQDRLWSVICGRRCNRQAEMDRICKGIGECNHRINLLITQLGNYRKTHPAMKLAYNFVNSEIARNKKLIADWNRKIDNVEHGRNVFVMDNGREHTDTGSARHYVKKLKDKVRRYEETKRYLSRYI